ncbi:hypothetical protein Poly30_27560 [Planctomycetes bacterium Poly30]|uniref:Uncharacterized protein n=1 Tax=Saltatorellus ferox TaxID=2528018 RepID=A0A518ET16_9BACT|nr:hypothetical protein Poly30_27560 [Planctomycetes bacterium Poly30]
MKICALLALASAIPASAQSIRLLHQSFDVIPGAAEIHGFEHMAVNDSGEWVISAVMVDLAANMSAGHAVFGSHGLVVYSQDLIPELGATDLLRPLDLGITEDGDAVFVAGIRPAGVPVKRALFVNDTPLLHEYRPMAIAAEPGALWTYIGDAVTTPEGRVVMSGLMRRPGLPNRNVIAEYRLEGQAVTDGRIVTVQGDLPAGSTDAVRSLVVRDAGEDGRHLTWGRTASGNYVLLQGNEILGGSGLPSVIPGVNWDATFFEALGSVNSRGEHAYVAGLSGTNPIVLVKNGEPLYQALDSHPAIAPYRLLRFSTLPSRKGDQPHLLESGSVVWAARWDHPAVLLGGGLFLDDSLIIEEGVTTLGSKTINGIRSDKMGVSPNGRWVILECWLSEPGQAGPTYGVVLVDLAEGVEYCSPAAPNSTGSAAAMTANAPRVAAGEPLGLVAHGLPASSMGYFLVAPAPGFTVGAGGGQGTLCLSQPIGRFLPQAMGTGPGGFLSATVDTNALPLTPNQAVLAGETWYFQAWYRDLNPTLTSNISSAIAVTF